MFNARELVLSAMLGLVVAHDIRSLSRNYKLIQFFCAVSDDHKETQRGMQAQIDYLCHLLNENGITADEFDLIALNNPIPEE